VLAVVYLSSGSRLKRDIARKLRKEAEEKAYKAKVLEAAKAKIAAMTKL
jgi:hypothetical protein